MPKLKSSGRKSAVLIAGFITAAVAAYDCRAKADVMEQLPADTMVVLKVNDLEGVSHKVARMSKDLGLEMLNPDLSDPLGALEEKGHLTKGINKSGDMAVAFINPKEDGEPQKSIMVLLPVSDYNEFLKNFKSTAKEGEVTKATPEDGPDVYVDHWGTYAVISPEKALLSNKPTGGLKLNGVAEKESTSKDAIIYANMAVVREKALPELKKNEKTGLEQMKQAMEANGAAAQLQQYMPLIEIAYKEAMNVAEEFLKDARHATVGIALNDEGIKLTAAADFDKGSYIGNLAGEIRNTDKPLLAGLPDRQYVMFGGSINTPATNTKLFQDIIVPLEAELAKNETTKSIVPALEAWKKAGTTVAGGSYGWVAPNGALGAESLVQQVSVIHGSDSAAVLAAQRDAMTAAEDMIKALQDKSPMKTTLTYKKDAKTIGGISFDSFQEKIEVPADNPQGPMIQQMLSMIYGPNGQTGLIGNVNGSTSLMLQCAPDALISDSIASAKADKDVLSDRELVKSISEQLPKQRDAAFYIDLGTLARVAITDAKSQGLPVDVKMPKELPPIGMTIATDGTAFRVDGFIPSKLVQALVSAGLQIQQQSRGGGNGGL